MLDHCRSAVQTNDLSASTSTAFLCYFDLSASHHRTVQCPRNCHSLHPRHPRASCTYQHYRFIITTDGDTRDWRRDSDSTKWLRLRLSLNHYRHFSIIRKHPNTSCTFYDNPYTTHRQPTADIWSDSEKHIWPIQRLCITTFGLETAWAGSDNFGRSCTYCDTNDHHFCHAIFAFHKLRGYLASDPLCCVRTGSRRQCHIDIQSHLAHWIRSSR